MVSLGSPINLNYYVIKQNLREIIMPVTQRIYWLDITRTLAILLVVFTHIHEELGVNSLIVKSLFYNIDRLGVPLFFMLSGSLILPKLVNGNIVDFYKKRIPQFIFLLFIYSFFTNIVEKTSTGIPIWQAVKDSFIFFNGIYPANTGSGKHLWFMYTIIALYLIAPFLAKLLDKLTNKEILLFLTISIFLTQLKWTLFVFGVNVDILQHIGSEFLGGYLNFFILGYFLIHRKASFGFSTSILLLILPIVFSLLVELYKGELINEFHWYSLSLQILISSVGLLNLIRLLFSESTRIKLIEKISLYSFGIYLSHYIFIYIFKMIIDFSSFSSGLKLIILYIPSFIFSYIFTLLLSKNKFTRYLVM
jgi:Uncharacterized protein conserved in bacteria